MMAMTPKRLFLSLLISISLLRPYTFFSRSPLVFKKLSLKMRVSSNELFSTLKNHGCFGVGMSKFAIFRAILGNIEPPWG